MFLYTAVSVEAAGVLYLLAFVAGLLSVARAVDGADYLTKSVRHAPEIEKAIFFQCVMGISYLGVALILYPALKVNHAILAAGFLVFRLLAVIFLFFGAALLHMILMLSRSMLQAAHRGSSFFRRKDFCLKVAGIC